MQSYKYTIFRTCKTMAIFALGRKIVDEKGNLRRLFEKHHLFHDLGNEFQYLCVSIHTSWMSRHGAFHAVLLISIPCER